MRFIIRHLLRKTCRQLRNSNSLTQTVGICWKTEMTYFEPRGKKNLSNPKSNPQIKKIPKIDVPFKSLSSSRKSEPYAYKKKASQFLTWDEKHALQSPNIMPLGKQQRFIVSSLAFTRSGILLAKRETH